MEDLCNKLKNNYYKNILIIAGAGISVPANIPDFRTSGVFDDYMKKYNLRGVEELFSRDIFLTQPHILYDVMKCMMADEYQPASTHKFIKKLDENGIFVYPWVYP